jgi:hypothetical protein
MIFIRNIVTRSSIASRSPTENQGIERPILRAMLLGRKGVVPQYALFLCAHTDRVDQYDQSIMISPPAGIGQHWPVDLCKCAPHSTRSKSIGRRIRLGTPTAAIGPHRQGGLRSRAALLTLRAGESLEA